MFRDKTIERKVMEVVRGKIAQEQALYEEEAVTLEESHKASMDQLVQGHEVDKVKLVDKHVNKIIGKLL